MKEISNDHSDDKKWSDFLKRKNLLYVKSTISLNPKRDSGVQKRIQCSITYNNFINIILKENLVII